MRKACLFLLAFGLFSCSQQTSTQQPSDSQSASQPTAADPNRKVLDDYLADMQAGNDGIKFWCNSIGIPTLSKVRSTKVLQEQEYKEPGSKIYTVQVESSNPRGTLITENWNVVTKGGNKPCVKLLVSK